MSKIHPKLYSEIVKKIPILCIDIIIIFENKYLLVKRKENPLKNNWWVPGGRILLGETSLEAAKRKLDEELNLKNFEDLKMYGIYEDIFKESSFGKHLYHTHSIVFTIELEKKPLVKFDSTISEWKFDLNLPKRFLKKTKKF